MAKFEGSLQDFHLLVGPKIRNLVASITKKKKNDLSNICQKCNSHEELDAAHIHGRSRKDIINIVLEKYEIDGDKFSIPDLHIALEDIKLEHLPIEKNFLFLCKKCHTKYDSWTKQLNTTEKPISKNLKSLNMSNKIKNPVAETGTTQEILCKIETNSWKYKLGWTSIQNRKNIEELISKIESTFDCNPLAFKSWYFHKRRDNNKQFSGIICHKNHSLMCFRIEPDTFDVEDDRIIRGKRWFFSEGKEARMEIIPENFVLIMKCLSYSYDVSS